MENTGQRDDGDIAQRVSLWTPDAYALDSHPSLASEYILIFLLCKMGIMNALSKAEVAIL